MARNFPSVLTSQSARSKAAACTRFLSATFIRFKRALDALDSFKETPQAFVTTDAVKFSAIGIFTDDHMGSTLDGLEAGIAPAN